MQFKNARIQNLYTFRRNCSKSCETLPDFLTRLSQSDTAPLVQVRAHVKQFTCFDRAQKKPTCVGIFICAVDRA